MTREDRWIVSLDEIRAIRWECPKCSVAMSFAINQTVRLPAACPSCNADAFDTDHRPEHRSYTEFVKALKAVVQSQQAEKPALGTVRLEFLADTSARR